MNLIKVLKSNASGCMSVFWRLFPKTILKTLNGNEVILIFSHGAQELRHVLVADCMNTASFNFHASIFTVHRREMYF